MEYVHSCFYSENAPKVHNVPYRTCEIFMSLVIEADEFERGKQAAVPTQRNLCFVFRLHCFSSPLHTHFLLNSLMTQLTCRAQRQLKPVGSTTTATSLASKFYL